MWRSGKKLTCAGLKRFYRTGSSRPDVFLSFLIFLTGKKRKTETKWISTSGIMTFKNVNFGPSSTTRLLPSFQTILWAVADADRCISAFINNLSVHSWKKYIINAPIWNTMTVLFVNRLHCKRNRLELVLIPCENRRPFSSHTFSLFFDSIILWIYRSSEHMFWYTEL